MARHGRTSTSCLPVARFLTGNTAQGVPPLPDAHIAAEVTNILFAATDTSATMLVYLFFELAWHPL
jgi:cytochrome P450